MADTSFFRFPTLTDQLYQLATHEVTSEELVRRSLHAIDLSQPTLNAFRVVLAESALADAAEADRRRAAGEQAPLLGIPIAVKDDVDIAGVPTAFGTSGYVPPAVADSEVVRRLKAAGAVIVGKTNTCELGQWPFTSGPAFGHTRNPWSRRHTPGGSSGGSAAAVAAGLVAAAIGSDGAGSIRIPAAWTHLVGIKPQRGRISTWPLPEAFNGITVNGVLARTVEDAALVLDAVSGNVDGDLHKPPPVTVSDYVGTAPGPLKIAVSTLFPFTGFRATLHPEIKAALDSVAEQLRLLGHTVMTGNPDYGVRLSVNFLSRSTAGLLDWAERLGDGVDYDRRTLSNMRMGRLLSGAVLRRARAHEAADQRRVGSIFHIVDVVLAPTTAQPPPPVHAFDNLGGLATDRTMIKACPVTWPWNLLGWPSINVPAGFTSAGLPIGVQLMGPANSEPLLVSLAAELEAVMGWAAKQPDAWWNTGTDTPPVSSGPPMR
ncbi:amidase [Mycobacterium xenopi]|uniref:amidase n=1 Tax=Mycobacterium xenopi TaxID=1789 RepID=A0AAD1M166_MYCXE|nr:amidase [Mycobacterium xenopi]EID11690.1 amidase [Mycobacterium xenopi RIVM700367]MDA3638406.1 amidase [Mycobacterium xenopi]MDA3662275.1 amidase [Mycobacterium xenopi]ORX21639.1 amidase [Mycobacterium xenopi]SPX91650.1 amidase [Mycobacterium xenopi]